MKKTIVFLLGLLFSPGSVQAGELAQPLEYRDSLEADEREMNRWFISEPSFVKADDSEDAGEAEKGSKLIDRDLPAASAAVRGGAVFPIVVADTPGAPVNTSLGFALGAALDFFPNPFFGWGIGIEYHQNMFSASSGEPLDTVQVRNLIFPFSLRFQVPLGLSNGAVTLIPWVSAGLSISMDIGRISEDNEGTNFPIHIQAPLSAGVEITTKKARDTVIWGVEVSYIPGILSPDFYKVGIGPNAGKLRVSHFRFGIAVRFPFGDSASADE